MATKINEAFISELLAEIIRLEEKINGLPVLLDQSTVGLTKSADALDRAGQGFRDHIDQYMKGQQEVLANNITILAQNAIRSTADIQAALINKAVNSALEKYEKNRVDNTRKYVIIAVVASIISALVTAAGFLYFGR